MGILFERGTERKGCYGCDFLEYVEADTSDGHSSGASGWDCNHHSVNHAKFPHKRKCKYFSTGRVRF